MLFLLFYSFNVNAQMTLEHTYSAIDYGRMIRLSNAGYKYVMMDYANDQFGIYNLDHTLYRMIDVPQFTGQSTNMDVNWVSDHLFNSDNLIEYAVYYSGNHFRVFNEDGVLVSDIPGYGSGEIFFDDNGNHKFFMHTSGVVSVYALPGYLPCMPACGKPLAEKPTSPNFYVMLSEPVPNPSNDEVNIDYMLPPSEKEGNIAVYNSVGQVVRNYSVSGNSKSITIKTTDLAPDMYFILLQSGGFVSEAKKLNIIR
jgi:hypothetical protein